MNFLDDEYNTDVQKELEPENSKRKVIENVDGNLGLIKLAALDKLPDYSEDDWDDWDDDYYYEKTKKGYCNNRKKWATNWIIARAGKKIQYVHRLFGW